MQVTSIGSLSYQPTGAVDPFTKMKQLFQQLGSALESGNLSNAKEAMAELQKNAPARAGGENNPLSAKIETLNKAVDSGDLKAAQQAYADIKKTISQRPPAPRGGPESGRGGASAGGPPPGGAKKSSTTGDSSSSNKTYDKKDTNKDGTVSLMEELTYSLMHSSESKQTSATAKVDSGNRSVDVSA